jgi:hypothetical protein
VWRLCIDHKGNLIRNPNDVRFGMTLEQVEDAHELMDFVGELIVEANKPKK